MATPNLTISRPVSLKNHPTINERWLQEKIIENPSLLGLGDLMVHRVERQQPTGGRVDLILQDEDTRYEVELQLGPLDESHIIRTIEYWDMERRLYPRLNHIAVIVAEDVTSRFLNVITLLAGSIPLIAIQIHGLQVGEAFTLVATRVVDMTAGQPNEDDDGGDPVDRTSWERRSSRESLETMDRIMDLVNEVQPGTAATYKKHYIGLATNGMARNFMQFWPRKTTVVAGFRMDESEDMSHWIDEIGLTYITYRRYKGQHQFHIQKADVEERREALLQLIRKANEA